jgi:hypothetical protein
MGTDRPAGLAAGSVLVGGLLDLKIPTDGFLTHGRWHNHGVILFGSTTSLGAVPEFRSGVIIYESMRPESASENYYGKADIKRYGHPHFPQPASESFHEKKFSQA